MRSDEYLCFSQGMVANMAPCVKGNVFLGLPGALVAPGVSDCVVGLQVVQSCHDLIGAAPPDAEDLLDRRAVEVAGVHAAAHV